MHFLNSEELNTEKSRKYVRFKDPNGHTHTNTYMNVMSR